MTKVLILSKVGIKAFNSQVVMALSILELATESKLEIIVSEDLDLIFEPDYILNLTDEVVSFKYQTHRYIYNDPEKTIEHLLSVAARNLYQKKAVDYKLQTENNQMTFEYFLQLFETTFQLGEWKTLEWTVHTYAYETFETATLTNDTFLEYLKKTTSDRIEFNLDDLFLLDGTTLSEGFVELEPGIPIVIGTFDNVPVDLLSRITINRLRIADSQAVLVFSRYDHKIGVSILVKPLFANVLPPYFIMDSLTAKLSGKTIDGSRYMASGYSLKPERLDETISYAKSLLLDAWKTYQKSLEASKGV